MQIKLQIKLTEEQFNNLKIFLSRVDLKGVEVPAFVEIMQQIEKGEMDKDGE